MDESLDGAKTMKMQCFPLYTLLLALGSPTVDFLSLDIEVSFFTLFGRNLNFPQKGPELEVLQTIPWTKVLSRTQFESVSAKKSISTLGGHSSYQRGDRVSHLGEKVPNIHLLSVK